MRLERARHLREVNRFSLTQDYRGDRYVWTIRARSFSSILATVEVNAGADKHDVYMFCRAIGALCDVPAPQRKMRRKRRSAK